MRSDSPPIEPEAVRRPRPARHALFALVLLALPLMANDCDPSVSAARRAREAGGFSVGGVSVESLAASPPAEEPGPGPAPAVPEPGGAALFALGALLASRALRRG
jgi:hypothetical protein